MYKHKRVAPTPNMFQKMSDGIKRHRQTRIYGVFAQQKQQLDAQQSLRIWENRRDALNLFRYDGIFFTKDVF